MKENPNGEQIHTAENEGYFEASSHAAVEQQPPTVGRGTQEKAAQDRV